MERLYSVEEAADALRLKHWTIRAWIKRKKLNSCLVGRRRVIRESELQKLIVDTSRKGRKK